MSRIVTILVSVIFMILVLGCQGEDSKQVEDVRKSEESDIEVHFEEIEDISTQNIGGAENSKMLDDKELREYVEMSEKIKEDELDIHSKNEKIDLGTPEKEIKPNFPKEGISGPKIGEPNGPSDLKPNFPAEGQEAPVMKAD
ncbi:MAG: hypothetical protein Q4D29_12535 [Lachnospiraceae bacterium]|nr:hypothetical protein [Lachnospiraceae bacterium]